MWVSRISRDKLHFPRCSGAPPPARLVLLEADRSLPPAARWARGAPICTPWARRRCPGFSSPDGLWIGDSAARGTTCCRRPSPRRVWMYSQLSKWRVCIFDPSLALEIRRVSPARTFGQPAERRADIDSGKRLRLTVWQNWVTGLDGCPSLLGCDRDARATISADVGVQVGLQWALIIYAFTQKLFEWGAEDTSLDLSLTGFYAQDFNTNITPLYIFSPLLLL